MSANLQAAIPVSQTAVDDAPENAPLRESSGPGPVENGRIVEVAFKPLNARFRESLNNPPRKPRNADRRSREFLTPAEVERLSPGLTVLQAGHRPSVGAKSATVAPGAEQSFCVGAAELTDCGNIFLQCLHLIAAS